MLRFVVSPDGVIVPDLLARLPGRGIWLSAQADVIHSPRTRQAFSRAARARVEVPDDLGARVQSGLTQRIGELLGLARRAGQTVAGYQKAHEWLVSGRAALIVQASDGSNDERARFLGGARVAVIAPLTAAKLGAIFGRDEAVHVAVAAGKLATSLCTEAGRLAGVLGDGPSTSAPERNGLSDGASGVVRDRDLIGR